MNLSAGFLIASLYVDSLKLITQADVSSSQRGNYNDLQLITVRAYPSVILIKDPQYSEDHKFDLLQRSKNNEIALKSMLVSSGIRKHTSHLASQGATQGL